MTSGPRPYIQDQHLKDIMHKRTQSIEHADVIYDTTNVHLPSEQLNEH